MEFFRQRGLRVDTSETAVCLSPGELLIFDNVVLAHGRRGSRRAGELRQRVFGRRSLSVEKQIEHRERLLATFAIESAPEPVSRIPRGPVSGPA